MSDGLPAGTITIADLYRELTGMRADVGKALEKLAVIDSRNGDADKLHADHEARLRALERFRYGLAGFAVIGGVAAGWIGELIGQHVHLVEVLLLGGSKAVRAYHSDNLAV